MQWQFVICENHLYCWEEIKRQYKSDWKHLASPGLNLVRPPHYPPQYKLQIFNSYDWALTCSSSGQEALGYTCTFTGVLFLIISLAVVSIHSISSGVSFLQLSSMWERSFPNSLEIMISSKLKLVKNFICSHVQSTLPYISKDPNLTIIRHIWYWTWLQLTVTYLPGSCFITKLVFNYRRY